MEVIRLDWLQIALGILACVGFVALFTVAAVAIVWSSVFGRYQEEMTSQQAAWAAAGAFQAAAHAKPSHLDNSEMAIAVQGLDPTTNSHHDTSGAQHFSIPKSIQRAEKCRICLFLRPFFFRKKRGE